MKRWSLRPEFPIPAELSILIGEVLYNLRASLDYLVYELSALDSGSYKSGTQFLIEDTPDSFQRRRKTHLKGINDSYVAAIERLQACNGIKWTQLLRTLSNPDKHRHLVINTHSTKVVTSETTQPTDLGGSGDGLFFELAFKTNGRKMYVNIQVAFFTAFEDGLPVVDSLQEIKTQVAQVLTDFKPEFKRSK